MKGIIMGNDKPPTLGEMFAKVNERKSLDPNRDRSKLFSGTKPAEPKPEKKGFFKLAGEVADKRRARGENKTLFPKGPGGSK